MSAPEPHSATALRSPTDPSPAARRARTVTSVVFFAHAALFASWAPRIPAVRDALHLNDASLGLALLGAPVGSVAAGLLAGALASRWGSTAIVRVALIGYCLTPVLIAFARSVPELFGALLVCGVFQSALDVSMNAQAGSVENHYGRSIFASFHAWWSLGAFAGTGVGALCAALDVPLAGQLLGGGAVLAVLVLPLTRLLLPRASDAAAVGGHHLVRPNPVLLGLGAIAFLGLLCEGAAADWSAVYLRENLGLSAGAAGTGYAAFALAMFVGRVVGDRVITRLGARNAVRAGTLLAGTGLGAGVLLAAPAAAITGFALLGLGLGLVVPCIFSASSRVPGLPPASALAAVSTFGWAGFLCGPPVLGFVAQRWTLPVALGVVAACGLVMTAIAAVVPRRTGPATPIPE